jgi:hypothetical protein
MRPEAGWFARRYYWLARSRHPQDWVWYFFLEAAFRALNEARPTPFFPLCHCISAVAARPSLQCAQANVTAM